ncbi:MAG: ABC transporter permease [Oscillospiraceae bacterium]|jgi:peptide/nickel transport system permease protein|nr:ABC transporter permease [Oscillospiraceae bacterium]
MRTAAGAIGRPLKNVGIYLLRGVSLLLASTIIAFFLSSIAPQDDPIHAYIQANPGVSAENVARMEEYWGLNQPPVARYVTWLKNILSGDMGYSTSNRRPVAEVIGVRFRASIALMMAAWIFSGILGFGVGCIMGRFAGRLIDRVLKRVCLVMCSIPTFWIGIVFLVFFSVTLGWFPFGLSMPIGANPDEVSIWQRLHHLVLPALTVSFLSFANLALVTREKLADVMESGYILFAKARGEKWILRRHALRNILIPAVTMQFGSFSELFGGSVIAENIFSYPGLGSALTASGKTDLPLFLGITLFSVLFVFCGNMIANILYSFIDPRVKRGD